MRYTSNSYHFNPNTKIRSGRVPGVNMPWIAFGREVGGLFEETMTLYFEGDKGERIAEAIKQAMAEPAPAAIAAE